MTAHLLVIATSLMSLADLPFPHLKMVQMGRIFQAPSQNPERADQIVVSAKKRMCEATDSFHSTLDEMEMEIVSLKTLRHHRVGHDSQGFGSH